MKPFTKIFFLFLIVLFGQTSYATNYYVAVNGNDLNLGTSISLPFATIAKAITKASAAGDTIFVRSGTYIISATQRITRSGTAARPIVLTAYKPDLVSAASRPVFDFSSMAVSSSNQGFILSGASYWNLYGFVIKGAGDNGMLLQSTCHHLKIEFCSFTRNRDSGLQIRSGSHHCLILNCDSYENADLGTGTTSSGGNADGFAPKLDVGDSIIFRGCRAWMNSDDGWDGYLTAIENGLPDKMTTILEDCWAFKNGYYWLDGSTTSSQNGNGFKMGGSANKDQGHHFVVKKCLSFKNKAKGFDQNNNAGSMYLYNNTAVQNGDYDYGLNSSGVTYVAGANLSVVNCISFGIKGKTIRTTGGGSIINTNNSFITSITTNNNFISTDSTGASGSRNLDGSLPTLNYMRLLDASSYIDAGKILDSIPYHDSIGIPFYGTKPDLGAFEKEKVTTYTFNANGNWSAQSNWLYHNSPPETMISGSTILIDPISNGSCVLDKPYSVSPGCFMQVNNNKILLIPSYLIQNN